MYFPQPTQYVNVNAVGALLLCPGHCRTQKIPDERKMRKDSAKGRRPSGAT